MRLIVQPQGGCLLAQIEQDVLDDEKPLGAALRSGAEKMHAAGQSYRVVTAACVGNLDLKGVSGACRSSRVPCGARRHPY